MRERGRERRKRRPGEDVRYGSSPDPDSPDVDRLPLDPQAVLGPGSLIHRVEDLADELGIGADAVLEQSLGLLRRLARIGTRWGTTPAGALRELLEQSRRLAELRQAAVEPRRGRRPARPARASERLPLAWVALRRELDDLRAREDARVFDAMGGRRPRREAAPEGGLENPLLDESPAPRRGRKRSAGRQRRAPLSPVQLYRKLREEADKTPAPASPATPGSPVGPRTDGSAGAPRAGAHPAPPRRDAPATAPLPSLAQSGAVAHGAQAPASRLPAEIELQPATVEPEARGRGTYADHRRPLKKIEL